MTSAKPPQPVVSSKPRPTVVAEEPLPLPAPALSIGAANDSESEQSVEEEKLVDFTQLWRYIGFGARSLLRHPILATATFLAVVGLTGAALVLLPKTYYVQTKLLAQRNAVMTALSNPGRAVPWDADAPTRAAAETVLRRDNLISLIQQTNLMEEWERTRAPILKVRDWLTAQVIRAPTPDEKLDAMILLLEARMRVNAGPVGDGTVTIELFWPDAQMAFNLVEAAQQAFLDARQEAETAAIGESIAILERYSKSLHGDINKTLAELEKTQHRRSTERPAVPAMPRALAAVGPEVLPHVAPTLQLPGLDTSFEEDRALAELKTRLDAKRTELSRLEEGRQRQVADLQARLNQLTTVYTPTHPSVITAQQNISALSRDLPQVAVLKAEIETLEGRYEEMLAAITDEQIAEQVARRAETPTAAPAAPGPRVVPRAEAQPAETASNGPTVPEFASLRLRTELNQLESVLQRTDGARIELAVSQAAFKYRYSIITPAQVPRRPANPDLRFVFAAGLLASLALALAATVLRDILSRRILEAWQIDRQLGLPQLGAVRIG